MSGNPGRASQQQQQQYPTNIPQQRYPAASQFQDGSYAHPPNQQLYQTQGGQVVSNQPPQSNPSQPISGSVQQNSARLTPMSQPTAPPTPPQQQQQAGPPQAAPQYVITQNMQPAQPAGVASGNPRAQYRQQQQGRPRQNMMHQGNQWAIQGMPNMVPGMVQYVVRQPYGGFVPAYGYNPQNYHAATAYGQMPANSQQRQAPQSVAPTQMAQPATSGEYQSFQPQMYALDPTSGIAPAPPVNQPPPPTATHPKTAAPKKTASRAIKIINPDTGKDIFDEDSTLKGANSTTASTSASSQGATVEKSSSTSHVSDGGKTEAVEDKTSVTNLEPSTPVVSAMTDGPSVDITPKHQVHKTKKIKPPEQTAAPAPVVTQQPIPAQPAPLPQQQVQQPPIQQIQITHPPELQLNSQAKISQIPAPESHSLPEPTPVERSESPAIQSQDNENNNVTTAAAPLATSIVKEPKEVVPEKKTEDVHHVAAAQVAEVPTPVVEVDANDTNNNNYQNASVSEDEKPKELNVTEKAPQDSNNNNNNSTNEKPAPGVPSVRSSSLEPKPTESAPAPAAAAVAPARKISIIEYAKNQWSPDNLEGEKKWTKEQLLQLKDQLIPVPNLSANVAKFVMRLDGGKNDPNIFSNLGMQNNQSLQYSHRGPSNMGMVAPKFMGELPNARGNIYPKRPSQTGGNSKQGMQGGRGSVGPVIKVQLGVHEDVKLNESENAWKPRHLVRPSDKPADVADRDTGDLCNRFRSMLNKLTAENFEVLVNEVKAFKIDTDKKLDGVIDLLFEKAISEPKFAPTYALLCREVGYIFHIPGSAPQNQSTTQTKKSAFKVKLITQCQKEFERHKEESKVFNEIEEEMSKIDELNNSEKEEKKALLEEKHFRIRQRANGTVRFIGELYKIDMLTVKIMRQCVLILLESPTEEKIERVCKLLTTIGHKMESEAGPEGLNPYFQVLQELLGPNRKEIRSSRIRFEIQNLQDLRHNKWRPRRADLIPKTMDELEKDMEKEQHMKNQERFNMKDDRNNRNNYRGGRQQDNEGWNNVGSNNKTRAAPSLPLNKLPTIPIINSEGPPKTMGMPTNFQNFNKFSGLQIDAEDGPPSHPYTSGSKNSSMERSQNRGSFYSNNGNAPYSGRSSGQSNQGSRNSSQNRSRDNSNDLRSGASSRSLQGPRGPASQMTAVKQPQKSASVIVPRAVQLEPLSDDDVKKNGNEFINIFKQFKSESKPLSYEDTLAKMEKLRYNKDVVLKCYEIFVDQKDKDRPFLSSLICELIKKKCITDEDNRAALKEIMELVPDMKCDVPHVDKYLAQMMAELLIVSAITFKDVYSFSNDMHETMLKHICLALKSHNADKVRKVIEESNISLDKFLNDGNLERFSKEIDFNLGKQKQNNDPMLEVRKMLENKKTLEEIHNFISSLGPRENLVSDLTNTVIAFCYEEKPSENQQSTFKLNKELLGDKTQTLIKFIDADTEKMLQCIEALYRFAQKRDFPESLLNQLFQIFYDNDVICAPAFNSWKKANSDKAGYGVVLKGTNQFFAVLAEEEDDDDYEDEEDDEGES